MRMTTGEVMIWLSETIFLQVRLILMNTIWALNPSVNLSHGVLFCWQLVETSNMSSESAMHSV